MNTKIIGIGVSINESAMAITQKGDQTTARVLTRKAFGELHAIKGAELKRRHYAYLNEQGKDLAGQLAQGLGSGKIMPQALRFNKKTGSWSASGITAVALAKKSPAEQPDISKLAAENAKLKEQLAALMALMAPAAAE